MKLSIKINSKNQAVIDNPKEAVRDALKTILTKLDVLETEGTIYDYNGNPIGKWSIKE